MRRLGLVAAAVAFVTLGVVSTPPAVAAPHAIGVVSFAYKSGDCPSPSGGSAITIFAGDTITWTNCSTTSHTVTSDDGNSVSFDHTLAPGKTYTRLFTNPGPSIGYHCEIHKDTNPMHGTILVQAQQTTTIVTQPPTTKATTTTTLKLTTTSPSTSTSTTQTTLDLAGVFDNSSTTSSSSTTTSITEPDAEPDGGGGGSSGLVVALLVLAIAGVGVGAYAVWRRMQQAG